MEQPVLVSTTVLRNALRNFSQFRVHPSLTLKTISIPLLHTLNYLPKVRDGKHLKMTHSDESKHPPFNYLYKHVVFEESDDESEEHEGCNPEKVNSMALSDFDISVPPHPLPGKEVFFYDQTDSICTMTNFIDGLSLEREDFIRESAGRKESGVDESTLTTASTADENDALLTGGRNPNFRGCSVRFGKLYIREYQRAIGDSICAAGPPLGIGWKYRVYEEKPSKFFEKFTDGADALPKNAATEVIVAVDKYERMRGPRGRQVVQLSRSEKEDLLIENGCARRELAAAVRHNLHVKNQRRQTLTNIKLMPIEEAFERWARSLRKLVMLDASKRKQARSRYLFEQWLDESGRGSDRSIRSNSSSYIPPDPSTSGLRGILIKDPESRRRRIIESRQL